MKNRRLFLALTLAVQSFWVHAEDLTLLPLHIGNTHEKHDEQKAIKLLGGPDIDLSTNEKDTVIIFNNKGGYAAKMTLEYRYWEGNVGKIGNATSGFLNVGERWTVRLPKTTNKLHLAATRNTGLIWDQYRDIVNMKICSYQNQWEDSELNYIQLDVWGTTLAPKHKFMQYPNTWDSGMADPLKECK